ncbi:hypothetical protein ACH436_06415 [Isoptericola sp. NPDC019693]|uniref:hypothetical protein n=1 Tax=Isoptericola sp. NPDC019693 TaxID=3364009 RepID=UPI0037A555A6
MPTELPEQSGPSSSVAEFIRRADAAGIGYKRDGDEIEILGDGLLVEFPRGRETRELYLGTEQVNALLATNFEEIRFLGDYAAIASPENQTIEAFVTSQQFPISTLSRRIRGLPRNSNQSSAADQFDSAEEPLQDASIRVEEGENWLELSAPSPTMRALFPYRRFTLKLPANAAMNSAESIATLESLSGAFFFDLDVRYGVALQLQRLRTRRLVAEERRHPAPPEYPQNVYPQEALELYRYGRSARGLPLLEFLAYYQAMEFFFPYFSEQATIASIKTELMDPGFNRLDDAYLRRLISLARPSSRGGPSERGQLRATIEGCIDGELLTNFISSSQEVRDHFCANKQHIPGLSKIQMGSDQDLRHQIADRIYALRCRIVHTKSDGGESRAEPELLLPSSDEVQWLNPEIELAKLVAQRVIVARSARALRP